MLLIIIYTVAIIGMISGCDRKTEIEWVSPYNDLDWSNTIQAKGQFHTHTLISGEGRHFSPHEVVDLYHDLGYDILAITDRWNTTWPWQEFSSFGYENRDPETLGMLAIPESEPQFGGLRQHHLITLFTDANGDGMSFEETLAASGEDGGLVSFAHPGRINEYENNELEDYIYNLDKYPHIYGFEIFTSYTLSKDTERWPRSKKIYSDILKHYGSPADNGWRPVWLTSTYDFSRIPGIHSDIGFQIQLLDNLDYNNVYNSLKDGSFFWVAQGYGEQPPVIESIDINCGINTYYLILCILQA